MGNTLQSKKVTIDETKNTEHIFSKDSIISPNSSNSSNLSDSSFSQPISLRRSYASVYDLDKLNNMNYDNNKK